MRFKTVIAANAKSYLQMMLIFINGLNNYLWSKLIFNETKTFDKTVIAVWKYYISHSYGQDEF